MKKVLRIFSMAAGGVMGAAAGMLGVGWCSLLTAGMICLGMGCVLAVCLHELAVIRRQEERAAEAARRSAYRAAFMREVSR